MALGVKAQLGTPGVGPARAWRATHHGQAAAQIESAGLACNGYSMGWRICDREGELILLHGGGYSGARGSFRRARTRRVHGLPRASRSRLALGDGGCHSGGPRMCLRARCLRAEYETDPEYGPGPGGRARRFDCRNGCREFFLHTLIERRITLADDFIESGHV